MCFGVCVRSYFESDDLPSALGVTEEALLRHPELVTDDMINMAAELYLAGHQHSKALQVDTHTHTHSCTYIHKHTHIGTHTHTHSYRYRFFDSQDHMTRVQCWSV